MSGRSIFIYVKTKNLFMSVYVVSEFWRKFNVFPDRFGLRNNLPADRRARTAPLPQDAYSLVIISNFKLNLSPYTLPMFKTFFIDTIWHVTTSVKLINKRAQRALGRSPEEKVKGHSVAYNREPQGPNLNNFGGGPFDDVIYKIWKHWAL